MRTHAILLALTAAFAVRAANGDDDLVIEEKDELDGLPLPALQAKSVVKTAGPAAEDITSVHSCWCGWYQAKWGRIPHDSMEPLAQEKLDEISDRYIAQCRAKAADEKNAKSGDVRLALGDALLFRRRWAEARAAYTAALPLLPKASDRTVRAHYRLAETLFGEGDREGAAAELRKAVGIGGLRYGRGAVRWSQLAKDALMYLTGDDLNYYGMPRDTGCKPFPEPQKASYTEEFAPCAEIALRLEGVDAKDARVALLTKKLSWRGFRWSPGGRGYPLAITLDPKAPVEKPEGYVLETTAKGASIRARDRQGVLWGIVSFLQIADPAKHVVRVCRVEDWPDCRRRGYLGAFWSGCTEFTVFNKLTMVVHQRHPLTDGADSPLNVYQCERMAGEFRDLGLDLEYGLASWTMNMGWPYCWKSYLGMQVEIGRKIAAMGAGVYYPNDDCRYMPGVLRPEDLKDGRKPSDFDWKHILDFFNGVREKHPAFTMTYCPPYYWGPRTNPYPDDPEKYLRSMRNLPPEVAIIWTGPAVKSYKKTPEQVARVQALTGHRPMLFQNATGPHNRLSYVMDRTDWNGWHYPGFFEEAVEGYLKNAHTPTECPQITSLADCLWNVKGYEPVRGIRRGMANFAGAEFTDLLDGVWKDLCHVDICRYGEITPVVLDEDPVKLEKKYARIKEATDAAAKLNGREFLEESCGVWLRAVGWYKGILDAARNPPDFRRQYGPKIQRVQDMAFATGCDPKKGDVVLDALSLRHGEPLEIPKASKGSPPPKNPMIYCGIWDNSTVDATFRLDRPAAKGSARLVMQAINDIYWNGSKPENRFIVRLNGKPVYDGQHPFRRKNRFELKIPLANFNLRGENRIEFQNGRDERQLRVLFAAIIFPKAEKDLESLADGENISLDE